ncbi:hypothetical protein NCS52_00752600 [Fusarium sp. LHS14.1]|nr:hypothetical protein NCS52_00752600 [Fusarium sp. LHS14.1]
MIVKRKYINFTPGVLETMVDLKAKLIQEYDRHEEKRVREYNTCCIVNLARRRIARFSKAGTENPPCVDARDLPKHLIRLTRAQDIVTAVVNSCESERDSETEEDEIKKEDDSESK